MSRGLKLISLAIAAAACGVVAQGSRAGMKEPDSVADPDSLMREYLREHKVMMFAKSYCGYCKAAKRLLTDAGIKFHVVDIDRMENGISLQNAVKKEFNHRTVPAIFVDQRLVGGHSDLVQLQQDGRLLEIFKHTPSEL